MSTTQKVVFADVTAMVHVVLGADGLELGISPETRFAEDLGMASIDMVALAGRLHARYGNTVNFARFAEGLGTESFQQSSVGDLVAYIVGEVEKPAVK